MNKSIEELNERLARLEFELRYESDSIEKDYIADDRDAGKKEIDAHTRGGA